MTQVQTLSDDAETLLLQLKEVREEYHNHDSDLMERIIVKLQEIGEYPEETQEGNPNSVSTMVSGWGPYWNRWYGTLNCPSCKAELRDLKVGPPFKRSIGISNGDSIHTNKCPGCDHEWKKGLK